TTVIPAKGYTEAYSEEAPVNDVINNSKRLVKPSKTTTTPRATEKEKN
ncbi:22373_t:CDS:1, partial [Racocetra persica]